ncbi:MAG TPA: restriction endonuclease subunit S, partial [Polyangiaceae bacterium]
MTTELPRGWSDLPLESLANITSGVGFPPVLQGRTAGDYPLAKVGDVSRAVRNGDGTIGAAGHWVDEADLKVLRATPLPAGSIVFAKIGEAIRQNFRALTTRSMIVDNNVMALVPHRDVVDERFLLHFTRMQDWYPLAVATTVPSLRKSDLGALLVPLAPLNEQRRIVAKLEALQTRSRRAREVLDAVPPLLEKLRQSILAAAFRGELTKDWRAKQKDFDPATELLKRICTARRQKWESTELAKLKSKGKPPTDDKWKAKYQDPETVDTTGLPALPDGWCWASLESLTDASRGIPYGIVLTGDAVADGVPTVRCGDIKDFDIALSGLKRVHLKIAAEFERTRLEGNEVLIAIRGTVGATAVATEAMTGMNISREVAMIPLLPGVASRYLMFCLASPEARARVMKHVKGVAQAGINLADLRVLPVPIAPEREQTALLAALEDHLGACSRVETERRSAAEAVTALDRSMLARAFRGELVPQDPTDEPAEAML